VRLRARTFQYEVFSFGGSPISLDTRTDASAASDPAAASEDGTSRFETIVLVLATLIAVAAISLLAILLSLV
jgi:hypothetical protein